MMIATRMPRYRGRHDEAVPEPGSGIGFRNGVQPMSKQRVVGATLTADQSKLVEHMAPLVKRIAYHFMVRLPASVQVDDLIQAGLLGLQDAAKNFDDAQGARFENLRHSAHPRLHAG